MVEVSSVSPAIPPNWRSSGVATDDAIVSGLAPGRFAETWIVGNSTCGRGETGSIRNAITPASATAIVSNVVATGFLMKGSEMLMNAASRSSWLPARGRLGQHRLFAAFCQACRQSVEGEENYRPRVERQHL